LLKKDLNTLKNIKVSFKIEFISFVILNTTSHSVIVLKVESIY